MKFKVKRLVEIEVKWVGLNLAVRYEDEDMPEDMPEDFPFRDGDEWAVDVEMDTGQIVDWSKGFAFDLYMKVCDQGTYTLYGPDRKVVAAIDEDYVPHGVVPGAYGDYVDLKINSDGVITNWPKEPDVSEFFAD